MGGPCSWEAELLGATRDIPKKPLSWWFAAGFFAFSLLAMLSALGWLIAGLAIARSGTAGQLTSMPFAYVAIITFAISVLIKPDRQRLILFGGLAGFYFLLFVALTGAGRGLY